MRHLAIACLLAACGHPRGGGSGGPDSGTSGDSGGGGGDDDAGANGDGSSTTDAATATDAASSGDAATTADAAAMPDAPPQIITGGPCISGVPGQTAYRIRWAKAGNTAQVVYEVNGLPDHSRDHAGAFGFQIGFVPQFVDPFLGDGGLLLDSSDFVDLELTTANIASIANATLSIFGRSFHTTTSGSFRWQTFDGVGSTPTNSVSNVPPYRWYSGDMTTELSPGDSGVLIRIKAGPNSGSLVVNRIELCMQAT